LIDPGSFLYTSDPDAQNTFRGTAAYNIVMIDWLEQNRFIPKQIFSLRRDASPVAYTWESGMVRDRFVGEHNGYARLADSVLHRRSVTFERAAGQVEVLDHAVDPVGGCGTHELMRTSPRYAAREQALVLRWKWHRGIPLQVRFSIARSFEWCVNG